MLAISEQEFSQLAEYIRTNYGIKLGPEKKSLVLGRLHNVLTQKSLTSFAEYYRLLVSDTTGQEAATLLNRITTNHTFFLREPQHFTFFREQVLPYLAMVVSDKDLRIWSAGCASGEEPYTLAMLLADRFAGQPGWNTAVLATDISSQALEQAAAGVYDNTRLAGLPSAWRKSYFCRHSADASMVVDNLRREVIFRKFNLMERLFPFKKKFHAIFCRNVMIYFDNKTKIELVNKFYQFTEPGGYLFIGHSESLNRSETSYQYVMPAVYRKAGY